MKRLAWIGVAAAAGILLLIFHHPRTEPAPSSGKKLILPPGWSVDHRQAPEFTRPRELLLSPAPSRSAPQRRLLAAGLRARAGTDPLALQQLLRDLHDTALSREYRELVALVLGSLDSPQAQEALAQALQSSSEPAWCSVLLHALGAEKVHEDDEIFDLPDGPSVYEISGLRMTINTRLENESIRRAMTVYLDHPDVEVRRAAARATFHSGEYADLRHPFGRRLRSEEDEGMRAGFGFVLGQWVASRDDAAPGRSEVVLALLGVAALPSERAVRFRLEEPLRRARLSEAELQGLIDLGVRGTLDQQLWALSVLRGKERLEPSAVESACARFLSSGPDSKVREYVAGTLNQVRTDTGTAILIGLLRDSEWNVRAAAARSLAGRPSAQEALTQASGSDPDPRVRQIATQALPR